MKTVLLGGRGSEKLLNFHHLQMMKNMEGGGSQSFISLLHRTQLWLTRISGPDGPLILAVDLRNIPKGGGYGRTHARTHTLLYIYRLYVWTNKYTFFLQFFVWFCGRVILFIGRGFRNPALCQSKKNSVLSIME